MALVECPECGGAVSDSAEFCPHCGLSAYDPAGLAEERKIKHIRIVGGLLIMIFLLLSISGA
tara:strand:+ start:1509 stop:1694 length:186 start_codon:yes stop_codon:yes gene_type:complete